jgi:hypothetical protein
LEEFLFFVGDSLGILEKFLLLGDEGESSLDEFILLVNDGVSILEKFLFFADVG